MKISFHEPLACPGNFFFFDFQTPLQKKLKLIFKKYTCLSYFLQNLFMLSIQCIHLFCLYNLSMLSIQSIHGLTEHKSKRSFSNTVAVFQIMLIIFE